MGLLGENSCHCMCLVLSSLFKLSGPVCLHTHLLLVFATGWFDPFVSSRRHFPSLLHQSAGSDFLLSVLYCRHVWVWYLDRCPSLLHSLPLLVESFITAFSSSVLAISPEQSAAGNDNIQHESLKIIDD